MSDSTIKPWERDWSNGGEAPESAPAVKPWERDWSNGGAAPEQKKKPEQEPAPEMSGLDKASAFATTYAEGLLGIGDELSGFGSELGRVVYDVFNTDKPLIQSVREMDIDRGIDQQRAMMDRFAAENPTASLVATVAGVGTSLFIPAMGAAKIAQTGTKLQRAAKIGALGAVEGTAYGYLSGRDEGRAESAAFGGLVGGVAGAGLSVFLRNSDEIARMVDEDAALAKAQETFIGGKEGFANVGYQGNARNARAAADASTQARTVNEVLTPAEFAAKYGKEAVEAAKEPGALGKFFRSAGLDLKSWLEYTVSPRAARLAEDSEWMGKRAREVFSDRIEKNLGKFDEELMLEGNQGVLKALQNLGRGDKAATTWDDVFAAAGNNPKLTEQLTEFRAVYDDLKLLDVGETTVDWIHTSINRGVEAPKGIDAARSTEHYLGPARAMMEYMDEVVNANALAERFGIKLEGPVRANANRVQQVIKAIGEKAAAEGADEAVVRNLTNGLESQFIFSKAGGDALGAMIRKTSSAARLGSPSNAFLNVSEWFTPVYQNGVTAWAKTVPGMARTALRETLAAWSHVGKYGIGNSRAVQEAFQSDNWVTVQKMGLGDQWMGEVANEAVKTANNKWSYMRYMMDSLSKGVYNKTLVTASNRTGQEVQINSAIQRGASLAKAALKGNEKARAKLIKHDGMRGLLGSEIDQTLEALANGDLSDPWVLNFAGAALNKWQPVSASSLPKALADNPNGRMWYSMLSYMNKQMNGMRRDVGLNLIEAQKRGLNTAKGREAMLEAGKNSASYIATYGMFAGLWERFRSSTDPSRDIDMDEVLTPEGIAEATIAQLASNVTSGLVDTRASEYGKNPILATAQPIDYVSGIASGVYKAGEAAVQGDTEGMFDELGRVGQRDVPGLSAVDKVWRTINNGERLFTQPEE